MWWLWGDACCVWRTRKARWWREGYIYYPQGGYSTGGLQLVRFLIKLIDSAFYTRIMQPDRSPVPTWYLRLQVNITRFSLLLFIRIFLRRGTVLTISLFIVVCDFCLFSRSSTKRIACNWMLRRLRLFYRFGERRCLNYRTRLARRAVIHRFNCFHIFRDLCMGTGRGCMLYAGICNFSLLVERTADRNNNNKACWWLWIMYLSVEIL